MSRTGERVSQQRPASEHRNSFAELIARMSAVISKSPGRSGCVSTKTAAEYRGMAEQCFNSARKTYTVELRETYLQLAQFWLEMASKLDAPQAAKQRWICERWLRRALRTLIVIHEQPGM